MAEKVFLIHPNEIKSIVRESVEDKTLRELVGISQETKLADILGDTLYNNLLTAIYEWKVNSTPLLVKYEALMPYIKQYLKYQVVSDFILVNHYKINNRGTRVLIDDNATAANAGDIEWCRNYYTNATATYKKILIDYLRENELPATTDVVDNEYSFRGIYMDIDKNYYSE